MGNTRDTGYLQNLLTYDSSGNIILPANLTVNGNLLVATQSYVTTQISNLINGAPALLDTLDELAAALGDDASFASTITTSIAGKQAQLNGTGFVKVTGTTISYDNSTYLTTSSASSTYQTILSNPVTGTGTTNTIPKFTGASIIGNSLFTDNGTNGAFGGANYSAGTGVRSFNISSPTYAGLAFWVNNVYGGDIFSYNVTGNLTINADPTNVFADTKIVFSTDGSDKVTILSNGNTSIGTVNPTNSKLLISGSHISGNSILAVVPVGNNVATIGVYNSAGARRGMFWSDTGFVRVESDVDPIQIAPAGNIVLTLATNGISTFADNVNINGTVIGSDQTFGSPYRTFAFGTNSNGFNRIFAANNQSDGIYINAATGQGINFRVNGGGANVFQMSSTGAITVGRNDTGDSNPYSISILRNGTLASPGTWLSTPAIRIEDISGDGPGSVTNTTALLQLNLGRVADADTFSNNAFFINCVNDNGSAFVVTGKRNIGILTNTPATALHVNGTALFTAGSLSGNTQPGVYIIDQNIYSLNGGNSRPLNIQAETIRFFTGTTYSQKMEITTEGSITAGNGLASIFTFQNNGTFSTGSGGQSIFRLVYGGLVIAQISNTGSGQRDGIFTLRDENVVRVNIAANASRGGDSYFNTGGNFGINTTNVNGRLVISGDDSTYILRSQNASASNQNQFFIVHSLGNVTIGNDRGTVTYGNTSDYRLKKDLKDYDALNIIGKLKTYNFKWIQSDIEDYGVIAHEMQEVLPNYVTRQKDEINEDGSIKSQSVDYSKLVPILVKAVQELKVENDLLKARLDNNNIN